jgi:hypothetical protein
VRGEYRGNPGFVDSAASNGILQRVRLTTNADITSDTSVKITLQDSTMWGVQDPAGRGGPALTDTGNNHLDLHEAYLKVNNLFGQPVSLKIGRQDLVYGDERLIGAFGWNNNGRSFDAVKATFTNSALGIDVFASKINDNTPSLGTNCVDAPGGATATCGGDEDQDFYGINATIKAVPNNTIEAYVYYWRDGNASTAFGQTLSGGNVGATAVMGTAIKASNLYTYGLRAKGHYRAFDYGLEVPFQSGSIDTTVTNYSISSFAFTAKAGYTLPTPMKIRIGAEYNTSQGDDDGGADTDIETFFNLFPTNHGHYGFMDQQGWRNSDSWSVDVKADVTSKLKLYLAFWSFKLNEEKDAWYGAANWNNTPTGIRAASSTNTESDLGTELDFVATYKYNSALTAQLGLSRFFTGKFLEAAGRVNATGNVDDMDFAYLQLTANF